MESTLTPTETFAATLAALRTAEAAFDARLAAFAEEATEEVAQHERHRSTLARLNSEITKAAYKPNGPPIMGVSAILPPLPPMRFGTVDEIAAEFAGKLLARWVAAKKGA
jgi:hypothetical protein